MDFAHADTPYDFDIQEIFFKYPDNNFAQKYIADIIFSIINTEGHGHMLYNHLVVGTILKRFEKRELLAVS